MEQTGTESGAVGEGTGWEKVKGVFRRLGPAGPMAVVASTLPAVGLVVLIGTMSRVAPWLREHGDRGPVMYVAAVAVMAGLALVPSHAPAALGGWAFGFRVGLAAAMTGFVAASLVTYAIVRKGAGDRVVKLIEEKPKWRAVHRALLGSGFWKVLVVVTLVRLSTSPFALTNLVFSAMRVNVVAYALGTLLGLSPRTAVVVYAAAGWVQLDFKRDAGQAWMFMAGLAVTVAVVIVIGVWAKRAVERVTRGNAEL
jgi:uncharacterized membrane protein YdjX (TVP38/TMEM64 family)